MPVEKAKMLKLIEMMDAFLAQREQDRLECMDEDPDTDPIEFGETLAVRRNRPIAEPPDPLTDGAPTQIHKSKDLFS